MEPKQLSMSEILAETEKLSSRKDKIAFLRVHYSKHMHEALAFAYDDNVKWLVPDTAPPYRPLESQDAKMNLHRECRYGKLYYFTELRLPNGQVMPGKGSNVNPIRREQMFIDLLESIEAEDAKLLVALSQKKIPYRGVTQKLIEEAWGTYGKN